MKKIENSWEEVKEILQPVKERPDLEPDSTFLTELNQQILIQNQKRRYSIKLYPIFAIASVLLIFTIVVLSFQNDEQLTTRDDIETFPIAETSNVQLVDTFVYGNGEGKVGLEFLGEKNTLPVTVTSFDVQNGVIYILDEARDQVLMRHEDTTTSFPIETYLVDVEGSLEDILVTENGGIYILSTVESIVYHYNVDGVLVENFDYSHLEMFSPDSLMEINNGEIVLSQSQEKFVSLETMDFIEQDDLPFRFERVNRKENKLFINEKESSKEFTIFEELGIGNRSVEYLNENQVILTKTITPPVLAPIAETQVLALSRQGEVLGGVRIPVEDFLERPQHPQRFVAIDRDKIYVLIPDPQFVSLYEVILGKEYESIVEHQVELVKIGYEFQSFGKPFPELEEEINNLLKDKILPYGNEDSLNGVAINEEGTVIIDFKDFLAPGPTSAETQQLFDILDAATFDKFPEIQEIYYQFDGSFSAWCYWLGSTEEPWKRPDSASDWISVSPNISEYSSMANWMEETIKLITSGVPNNIDKESHEMNIGYSTTLYANYYLQRTNDEDTIQTLNAIKDKAIQINTELDGSKREALLHELYDLLSR